MTASPATGPSNLRLRVISALVLAAVALSATWAGGAWFRLLVVVICGATFVEWALMAGDSASRMHRTMAGVLLAIVLAMLLAGLPELQIALAVLLASAAVLAHGLATRQRGQIWLAVAYAGFPAIALAATRGDGAAGLAAILYLFAVVWATDIAAYFAGRAIGGPKLAPSISPNKTWSGAVGGAIAAIIAGAAVAQLGGAPAGAFAAAGLALVLSVVSQAGDLYESRLKRRFGHKDSSRLLPGHGGMMDRVDGLVAAAVAFWLAGLGFAAQSGGPALFGN